MIRVLVPSDTRARTFRYEPTGAMASPLPMMARTVALVPMPVDAAGLWPKPSMAGAKRHGCSPKTVASVDFCKKKRHSRHGINFFDYLCPYKYNYLKT